jgi:hypothetical protein
MSFRLRTTAVVAAAFAALSVCAGAGAGLTVGVAEDAAKGHDDGGASLFSQLTGVGMSVVRISVRWDESQPTTITEYAALNRAIKAASKSGVQVVFIISPLHATGVTSTQNGNAVFAAFCVQVAKTFPSVRDFEIGNEPNQPRFWQPQFDSAGNRIAAATYESMLATTFDALKGYDGSLHVIGLGLSPRGNDDPQAPSNASTSPVFFIHDLGVAYRASGRTAPLMDDVGFHPYPNAQTADDPPSKGMQWPSAGVPNLDRLQQAWWDAFNGTGQPTFAEDGVSAAAFVKWILDETGWQTNTDNRPGYFGAENTKTVDEATQAAYYTDIVNRYQCDPHVSMLMFFHWIDEADRGRLQTGLARSDGSLKPSAYAIRTAILNGCQSAPVSWRHLTGVDGSAVAWRSTSTSAFSVTANEDFTYTATIVRGTKGALKEWGVAVRTVTGAGNAYYNVGVAFKTKLKPGRYVYSITLRSTMNPARATTFTSKPFTRT